MDKAISGFNPAVLQSSPAAFTYVRVQFDRFGCWVSIGSDPHTNWCGLNISEPSMQTPPGMMGGEKSLSVTALCLRQVGSNFALVAQCLQKTKWGMFAGVLLILQLEVGIQFSPCSKAVVTLLRPISHVNTRWVITVQQEGFFSVIHLSLWSMTTLDQHVSQACQSPIIPEIRSKLLFESYHHWLLKTSTSVHVIQK